MESRRNDNRAAALAGAVATEINDAMTVIFNSLFTETLTPEDFAAVERASLQCVGLAKGLALFAHRHGINRPAPLRALLDQDPF